MLYLRILDAEDVERVEAHENPVYVHMTKNGIYSCEERQAQGVAALDGSVIYQLAGKESLGLDNGYTAYPMYQAEYEEWIQTHDLPDPEDDDPEIPEDEDTPLTRAELTAKVAELEEQNAMLIGMLLENHEDSMKASTAYRAGDLIVVDGKLYKAIAYIANGATLTVGTNVTQTTVAAEIAAVNS